MDRRNRQLLAVALALAACAPGGPTYNEDVGPLVAEHCVSCHDGSADDPVSAVGEHAIVTSGPPLNSYAARNRAAALVRAPALAFCDADCRPDPTWLESGLASLERADIVAGLIRFVVPEHRTIWSLLDMDMHLDQARSVRVSRAATANLFVRRDVFDRLGGFDDSVPNSVATPG